MTAFRSPATATPLGASIPESTLPACHFDSRSELPRPVRFFGSATQAGLPQREPLHSLKPVAGSPPTAADLVQSLHSPPGDLPPSGSTRSAPLRSTSPPSGSARSPFAPRHRLRLRVPTTDHRSRSATFPEARCFSNLLEPSSLCSRAGPPSKYFSSRKSVFLNILTICFERITRLRLWFRCE